MPIVKISDFLTRVKKPIDIKDDERYKRITIKINHLGVLLRDIQEGHLIGTKKQFVVSKGQFILSKIDAMNGAFGIVSDDLDNAIITGNFWTFDFDDNKVNLDWFNLFTSSNEFVEICRKASSGTTHRKYLDEKKFNNYELELPDKKSQAEVVKKIKAIVVYQGQIKNEIESQVQAISALKQSILQDAIKGKLIPQDPNDESAEKLLDKIKIEKEKLINEGKIKKENLLSFVLEKEIPFELPKGWKWSRAENFCTQITDGTHHTPTYVQSGIPFLSVKDLTGGKLEFNNSKFIAEAEHLELSKRCHPEFNNILLTKVGTTGIARIVDTKEEFSIFVSLSLLKFNADFIDPHYLELCINSPYVRKLSKDGTEGIGNKNLVLRKIKSFLIPIPPINEQKRIVEKVHSLMKICDEQEKNINEAKENINKLNQSILREMFV